LREEPHFARIIQTNKPFKLFREDQTYNSFKTTMKLLNLFV